MIEGLSELRWEGVATAEANLGWSQHVSYLTYFTPLSNFITAYDLTFTYYRTEQNVGAYYKMQELGATHHLLNLNTDNMLQKRMPQLKIIYFTSVLIELHF